MKKIVTILILILAVMALAACNGDGQANATNDGNNNSSNGTSSSSQSSLGECTAQSQELPDLALEGDHLAGELENYAVTVIEYSNFQCEGCQTMAAAMAKMLELYPNDVRLIYRYFPQLDDPKSILAAKAAEAAGMQGKFWEMHDLLYATAVDWAAYDEATFKSWLWEAVTALNLDLDQFETDINSEAVSAVVEANYTQASRFGMPVPVVLVNGTQTPIYIDTIGDFYIWLETLMIPFGRHSKENQFSECPAMTIDKDATYTATVKTEKGDIVLALWPDVAPYAVNAFVFLAEHDYYDNSSFYAVIEGFIAQGGDPSGTGWGTPGFLFSVEISPDVSFDRPGLLAMANAGPTANNSQFFITFSPLTFLDGKYTIFGEVISGMDVLKSLTFRDPETDPLALPGDAILDVIIDKK